MFEAYWNFFSGKGDDILLLIACRSISICVSILMGNLSSRRIMSASKIPTGVTNVSQLSTTSSTEIPNIEVLKYGDFRKAVEENKSYIIDVREKNEIKETGTIPGSVNIPLGEVESALQLPPEEYQVKYNASKPNLDTRIIFSCRSGARSYRASVGAVKLGFQKVANFDGGWLEWESKNKERSGS